MENVLATRSLILQRTLYPPTIRKMTKIGNRTLQNDNFLYNNNIHLVVVCRIICIRTSVNYLVETFLICNNILLISILSIGK